MRLAFITKSPMQRRYLTLFLLSIMVPLFIVGGCLYYVMFQIMADQLAMPESIAQNLVPVLHRINFLLLICLPPMIVLLFILAVLLTHRLIGPLERLRKDLKKISDGNYSIRLKMRKDDDLRPIAEMINNIMDNLEKK